MKRLRLLKVVCQPVFVLDDGDELIEHSAEPVTVPAAEWPTYPVERFAESFAMLREQVEED